MTRIDFSVLSEWYMRIIYIYMYIYIYHQQGVIKHFIGMYWGYHGDVVECQPTVAKELLRVVFSLYKGVLSHGDIVDGIYFIGNALNTW